MKKPKSVKDTHWNILIHNKYYNPLDVQANIQVGQIANISVITPETNSEILSAIPSASKMISPGAHIPVRKMLLQDAKTADMQEQLNSLIHTFKILYLHHQMTKAIQN